MSFRAFLPGSFEMSTFRSLHFHAVARDAVGDDAYVCATPLTLTPDSNDLSVVSDVMDVVPDTQLDEMSAPSPV